MTRTVTLPLVWQSFEDGGIGSTLYVGSFKFGCVYPITGEWVCAEEKSSRYYPTRAAAMAALEDAVCALGVKQDG